jgi:hypothetical protein|tara:strand:- start:667 stop:3117 length:2451 start_codon:yes stop_codon:yes gene_type:complete
MSWDLEFVGSLNKSSLYVRYRLEFIGVLNALGEPFSVSDDQGVIQIARGSVRITGSRVIPQRWSVSFGGFSLQLSGDIRSILPKMRRGQIAVLQCSINRQGFRNLAIGSLDTISGQRGLFSLGFKDLLSALQTSLDTRAGTVFSDTDPPHFSLFYEVGRTTTTTSTFGGSDGTLNVADASFFKKQTGSKGIARITNTSVDFYVFWTGSTSTTLTGCTTAEYNNTSRVSAPSGSTVRYCAWLQGEPYEILASILTSTGTGNNGEFDVYPVEWSIGGKIDKQIFDVSDAKRASKEITRSGDADYDIGFAVESPLSNGFRSIVDIFLTVGIFPVYRQDSISIRACTDPEGIETRKTPDLRAEISDYDIIDVLSHDFFSPDISNIYRTTYIKYNFTNVYYSGGVYNGSRVDSLPALSEIERDFSLYYLADPDNRQSQALQDLRRLRVWDLYISERLSVRLPLRFATLVAGDIVTFRSNYVEHLYDTVDPIYKGRYCMVLGCDYSIDAQECTVTLGIPSPKMQRTEDTEDSDGAYSGWLPNSTYNNTQLFVWLSSDVDMSESGGDVTTWIDRQNSFSFSNQAGNNNTYNTGAGSPSKSITVSGFHFARFAFGDHEFLATDYNAKMDLSGTDGICVAMLIRAYADPIGDTDFSGGTYYKAPLVNCGRSYQLHLLDSFSGSTYTNAIGYDNNTNTFHQDNQVAPPDSNWKIVIYSSADVGGYSGEEGLYVNGTRVNTSDFPPTNADISLSPDFRIGRDPDINYTNQTQQFNFAFGSFDLAELLSFSIPLHDAEREKVEGYIAHKFKLTSLLPASHPYKNTVPT